MSKALPQSIAKDLFLVVLQTDGPAVQAAAASKQLRIACFDTESESLAMLEPTGSFPPSRGGHSVCTQPHDFPGELC